MTIKEHMDVINEARQNDNAVPELVDAMGKTIEVLMHHRGYPGWATRCDVRDILRACEYFDKYDIAILFALKLVEFEE